MADGMVHVFLKEYSDSIAINFKKFLDEDLYVDLIFVCGDKKRVRAHQIVLAYLSQFLYKILVENQFDSSARVIYICLPDVHFDVMERIIHFLYTGQIILDAKFLKEFNEVMQLLGMPSCSFTHTNEVITASLVETDARKESKGDNRTGESFVLAAKKKKTSIFCENGRNCALALAIGENINYSEQAALPTITQVESFSNSSLNSTKNLPVFSPVAAHSSNNEEESIKRIAKNLFVQLKRFSESNRQIRKDRIYKRYNSNRCSSRNETDCQERFGTRKLLRRCCAQKFAAEQMELDTFA